MSKKSDQKNDAFEKFIPEIEYNYPFEKDYYGLSFRTLLPKNLSLLYRYTGSLPRAFCDEGVIWTVLETSMTIGKSQVNLYITLLKKHKIGLLLARKTL